jgi:hypothetical protein
MRVPIVLTIAVLGHASGVGPVAAQSRAGADHARAAIFEAGVPAAPAAWHSRLLSALGGAALGAGVGFFASQVFTGDWDEEPGREVDRPVWAAVGGSIGFALGFTVPLPGRGRAPAPAPLRGLRGGRAAITADEMRGRGVRNALDAVQLLRPEWLSDRGYHVIGEEADERIRVYLDDVRLGGVPALRDVSIERIESLHFLDAGAATARWGAGHSHGAILIIAAGGTQDATPPR